MCKLFDCLAVPRPLRQIIWTMLAAWLLGWAGMALAQSGLMSEADSARLRALDLRGRQAPAAVMQELAAWSDSLPAQHPAKVPVLASLGLLKGDLSDAASTQPILKALDELPEPQADRAAARLLILANAASRESRNTDVISLTEEALRQLRPQAPYRWKHILLNMQGVARSARLQYKEAIAAHMQAVEWVRQRDPDLLKSNLGHLGFVYCKAGQVDIGMGYINQALELARHTNDDLMIAMTLTLAHPFYPASEPAQAGLARAQEALDHARRAGNLQLQAIALGRLSESHRYTGRPDKALEAAQAQLALDEPRYNITARFNRGVALVGLHRLQEGLAQVEAVLRQWHQEDDQEEAAAGTLELAEQLERSGYLAESVQTYQRYRALAMEAALRTQQAQLLDLHEDQEAQARTRNLDLLARDNALKAEQVRHRDLIQQAIWGGALGGSALLLLVARLLARLRKRSAELAQANARLHRLATEDLLTGLPNRRQITEQLTGPHGPALLSGAGLLLIDLDHFKRVNDSLGHARGDQVLVQTAQLLRSELGPNDVLARWGGEEFLVISAQTHGAALTQLAHRLLQSLRQAPLQVQGHSLPITASIGMARLPDAPAPNGRDFDDALQQADQALYQAKSAGRNRVMQADHANDWPPLADALRPWAERTA